MCYLTSIKANCELTCFVCFNPPSPPPPPPSPPLPALPPATPASPPPVPPPAHPSPLPPPWLCTVLGESGCETRLLDQPSYINALLPSPTLEDSTRLPSITSSQAQPLGGLRALLTLEGHDLGVSTRDVVDVRIGSTVCDVSGLVLVRSLFSSRSVPLCPAPPRFTSFPVPALPTSFPAPPRPAPPRQAPPRHAKPCPAPSAPLCPVPSLLSFQPGRVAFN